MTTTEDATASKNGRWHKGDVIALLGPDGTKVTQVIRSIDKLMPQLTLDELKELRDWMDREALMNPNTNPERRREILSRFEKCPCCDRWLGHNNPPAADGEPEPPYRQQRSFKFDR